MRTRSITSWRISAKYPHHLLPTISLPFRPPPTAVVTGPCCVAASGRLIHRASGRVRSRLGTSTGVSDASEASSCVTSPLKAHDNQQTKGTVQCNRRTSQIDLYDLWRRRKVIGVEEPLYAFRVSSTVRQGRDITAALTGNTTIDV